MDEDEENDVEDDAAGGADDEAFFEEGLPTDVDVSISLDNSAHQILEGLVDPIVWKTELERVGPKLKAQQLLSTNEWRAHVDQTVANNEKIEKVLSVTQSDLQIMNKYVYYIYIDITYNII